MSKTPKIKRKDQENDASLANQQKDEILLLCKELEELGGGIKTRLEKISLLNHEQGESAFIKDNILRFISLNYHTNVISYGPKGTGKTQRILDFLITCASSLLTEFDGQALFFLEAYELYIDAKSNTEKRTALIKVPNIDCKRHQIYLSIGNSKQQVPEIVRFNSLEEFNTLLIMIRQNSLNFDDLSLAAKPNQSHLFLKLHIWMDSRFQTLTLVDLAGTYPQESIYLNMPEINKTNSYIKTLVKSLTGCSSSQQSINKNSKIYKEFDALINGHAKMCFIGEKPPATEDAVRIPLIRVKKHKFNKMFIEYMVLQEMVMQQQQSNSAKVEKTRIRSIKREEQPQPLVVIEECPERPESFKPSPVKIMDSIAAIQSLQESMARETSNIMPVPLDQSFTREIQNPFGTFQHADTVSAKKTALKSEISEVLKLMDIQQKQPLNILPVKKELTKQEKETDYMNERLFLMREDLNKLKLRADHLVNKSCSKQDADAFNENLDFLQQDLSALIEQACLQGHFLEFKQDFTELDKSLKLLSDIDIKIRQPHPVAQAKKTVEKQPKKKQSLKMQPKLIMIHEKLYKKLESLITSEEGRRLAKQRSKPESLQLVESLINDFSELIVRDEESLQLSALTEMVTQMYEEMVVIFGRADQDMRTINKLIRDIISI